MDSAPVFHPSRSKYVLITLDYLIPLTVCFAVLALAYTLLYSPIFKINHITCRLDFAQCQDPVLLAELTKLSGQNIFTLKEGPIVKRLTSGDFTIRAATIKRDLPSSVTVELQSVYPVVALRIEDDPTWIVMDQNFRVIASRKEDPNVPTVIVPGPLTFTLGKPSTDESLLTTLSLARRLADQLIPFKTITLIDPDTIELTLDSGIKAILTPKGDELTQLRALQAILRDATIMTGVKTVDVRFSQPVLRP